MDRIELTGLYPNLARAYEIALLGGYSIEVFYNTISYEEAPEDIALIMEYFSGVEFKRGGNIRIEICKPKIEMNRNWYESIEHIKDRVENAVACVPTFLDNSCSTLLKIATERLNLGLKQVLEIKERAEIIARLDMSSAICAAHIAESIQYSYRCDHEISVNSVYDTLDKIQVVDLMDILDAENVTKILNYAKKLKR